MEIFVCRSEVHEGISYKHYDYRDTYLYMHLLSVCYAIEDILLVKSAVSYERVSVSWHGRKDTVLYFAGVATGRFDRQRCQLTCSNMHVCEAHVIRRTLHEPMSMAAITDPKKNV